MNSDRDRFYLRAAWLLILGGTLFRMVYAGTFLLAPDEANYWQWSRHMAWGYHDQAPLIAWAMRLTTWICGHNEIGVRLPSVLALGIASVYMVLLAGRYWGARAAFNTALLSQAILEFNVGGLMATADGLQAAAWAGACYHVARAYEDNRTSNWLLGGVWFGIGMLAKYTMIIFLPSAYLYGLLSARHRPHLAGFKPYIGVGLGLALFSPVVFWNIANNFNSFRHVAYIGGANEAFTLHFKYFGDLIASQAALLSPLVFILVLMAWWAVVARNSGQRPWIYMYLWCSSLPMVAGFALLSLHTRIYGNWPGAGYLAAAVLVAVFYGPGSKKLPAEGKRGAGRRIWPWAIGTAYVMTAVVLVQTLYPVLPLPPDLDRTSTELSGWQQVGKTTDTLLQRMPRPDKTFIFGMRYQIASQLAFYMPGQPQTVSINKWHRPNVYDYWWRDEQLIGWDAIGVTREPNTHLEQLNQIFERVDPPVAIEIFRDSTYSRLTGTNNPVKTLYLYRAYGFKGGLRWEPRNRSDIRAG